MQFWKGIFQPFTYVAPFSLFLTPVIAYMAYQAGIYDRLGVFIPFIICQTCNQTPKDQFIKLIKLIIQTQGLINPQPTNSDQR